MQRPGKRKSREQIEVIHKRKRLKFSLEAHVRYHRPPAWIDDRETNECIRRVQLLPVPTHLPPTTWGFEDASSRCFQHLQLTDPLIFGAPEEEGANDEEKKQLEPIRNDEELLKHDFFHRKKVIDPDAHLVHLRSLNAQQLGIYHRAIRGENLFVTGGAGRGKTFLLKCIVDGLRLLNKSVAVLAPTGNAAANVDGSTLDSFLQIPPQFYGPKAKAEKLALYRLDNYQRFLPLITTDVLIVDEMSMIDRQRFETLLYSFNFAQDDGKRVFGRVQIVGFADFFQLPPVVTNPTDKSKPSDSSKKKVEPPIMYCFQSPFWSHVFPWSNHVELEHSFRQTETKFVEFLDRLRLGLVSDEEMFALVEEAKTKEEPQNVTVSYLYGTRQKAKMTNHLHQQQLEQTLDATILQGECDTTTKTTTVTYETQVTFQEWTFAELYKAKQKRATLKANRRKMSLEMYYSQYRTLVEPYLRSRDDAKYLLEETASAPLKINLSIGTHVMLTKNIPQRGRHWVHGRVGVVTHFEVEDAGIDYGYEGGYEGCEDHPKKNEHTIRVPYVLFEGMNTSQAVDPIEWSVKFDKGMLTGRQLPLEYGLAMTIHKSQGASLAVAKIDLSQVFADGQAYVALSRLKTSAGLYLMAYKPGCIKVNRHVLEFYQMAFPERWQAMQKVYRQQSGEESATPNRKNVDDADIDNTLIEDLPEYDEVVKEIKALEAAMRANSSHNYNFDVKRPVDIETKQTVSRPEQEKESKSDKSSPKPNADKESKTTDDSGDTNDTDEEKTWENFWKIQAAKL